jgi:transposase
VTQHALYNRQVHGLSYGTKTLYFEFTVHRIYCLKCQTRQIEHFPFLSHPKSRITKALERTIIELRAEMSISAVANYFKLDWRTVKNCEKYHLKHKYRKIKLKNVKIIGIDEIFVSRRSDQEKYLTVVRDLESGAVLFVGEGKGVDGLQEFSQRLKRSRASIEMIAMDMSKAFIAWAKEVLPQAEIVFDHFHVIKLMNEKIDQVRRRITRKLDDDQKKLLKNQRFLFLRNVENLEPDAKQLLDNLRKVFKELGDASMLKEALRSIYSLANDEFTASAALKNWIAIAKQTEVPELVKMAETLERHFKGITAYWRADRLSNSAMEGFNNKIRWLIRQAYGFRDREYFKLKIYDLPNTQTRKSI